MAKVATRTRGKSFSDTYRAQAANQGRGLGVVAGGSGDDYRGIAAGAGVQILGVQDEASAAAGDPISVVELGDAMAIAGAAIAAGNFVKVTATGQFIPVTGTAGGGENVAGWAKSSAAAQGDEFILFVSPSVL
jgi:hypothetical protein